MVRTITKKSCASNSLFTNRWAHILIATVSLTALVSAPSFAQSLVTFSLLNISGTQTVGVSTNGGSTFTEEGAGRYQGTINGATYNVFCVDLTHDTSVGNTYTANIGHNMTDAAGPLVGNYYNGGFASALTPQDYHVTTTLADAARRSSQIAFLGDSFLNADAATFSNGLSGNTNYEDNLAAISLSVWDIQADGGDGINSGNMRIDSASQIRLGGLVSYYEQLALQNSNYISATAKWVQSPRDANYDHYQDVMYTSKPIPEASTFMLLGLIAPVIPFVVRRRRAA